MQQVVILSAEDQTVAVQLQPSLVGVTGISTIPVPASVMFVLVDLSHPSHVMGARQNAGHGFEPGQCGKRRTRSCGVQLPKGSANVRHKQDCLTIAGHPTVDSRKGNPAG